MMSIVNDRILEVIKEKGVSYRRLEEMTGISKAQIQRYANSLTEKIPLPNIEKIAKALNVNPAYLMGWEDKKEKAPTIESLSKEDVSFLELLHRVPTDKREALVKTLETLLPKE